VAVGNETLPRLGCSTCIGRMSRPGKPAWRVSVIAGPHKIKILIEVPSDCTQSHVTLHHSILIKPRNRWQASNPLEGNNLLALQRSVCVYFPPLWWHALEQTRAFFFAVIGLGANYQKGRQKKVQRGADICFPLLNRRTSLYPVLLVPLAKVEVCKIYPPRPAGSRGQRRAKTPTKLPSISP
jgi:hypothetical protein